MIVTVFLDPNREGPHRRGFGDVAGIIHTTGGQLALMADDDNQPTPFVTFRPGEYLWYTVEMTSDDPHYQHLHEDEGPRHVCPVCKGDGVVDEDQVNYDAVLDFASGFAEEEQE